ncbi:hypothetical protein B0H19DRAFT_863567, partial [Mycena capillaripes]
APLDHLLKTNYVPLEEEILSTREIIANEENRLRVLDENIAHVQRVLATLSRHRDECKEKIRRHSAVVSPLRCLPPEILGKIFLLTVPPEDEMERLLEDKSIKSRLSLSPWVLTRICSRWRNISVSFPMLW